MYTKKITNILRGGGFVVKNTGTDSFLELMMVSLLILLIKSFIVMVAYNYMFPRLMANINTNYQRESFKPINIFEGAIMVILFNNLFNRI
jgi:hypothetical protein